MPDTVTPGAAWNDIGTQSLSSPGASVTVVSPSVRRARAAARSMWMRSAVVSGGCPLTKALSGPVMTVSTRSSRTVTGTRRPPSLKRPVAGRVVKSMKVPCVPSRSGTHMALSSAP